jgi:hypothetical protein
MSALNEAASDILAALGLFHNSCEEKRLDVKRGPLQTESDALSLAVFEAIAPVPEHAFIATLSFFARQFMPPSYGAILDDDLNHFHLQPY